MALCAAVSQSSAVPTASAAPHNTQGAFAAAGFAGGRWGDSAADSVSQDSNGKYQPQQDPGSLFTVERAIGARAAWTRRDNAGRNITGKGVGVALLDTGVSPVPGLDQPTKVAYGPDLSIESNGPLTQQDTYGHGTFMAGIIAGRGATNPSADPAAAPANVQFGVAPDAKLLAMKLATTDGSTDVSQVIAGIDWVAEHPVLPDGTRIRVINLSYGTDSSQDYLQDPLAAAAENAWQHGIVVVAAAGNSGTSTGRLTDPAIDPYLIAVGATDSGDRMDGWAPDHTSVASFSNVASTGRHVDLVAPGTSIVSARDPNSYIDQNFPNGAVAGDASKSLFRGSGTSQATAVVSGAVALLLQAYPSLSPDQVKYALTSTADPVANSTAAASGAGTLDLAKAFDAANRMTGTDSGAAALRVAAGQAFPNSTGQGSLDAARGGSFELDADGQPIGGEIDVQGYPWDPARWWQASSALTAWNGGQWLGETWTGDDWATTGADGSLSARWSSARWSSARWSGADWDSARWSSARWSSARWSSADWWQARWSSEW
jgi:serine protease AprX